MNKKLSVVVISITPFDEQGKFDEAAYRKHLRRLRDAGVAVYVGGGGSGEGYTLTGEERDRVLAIAVEELKGKVPVRAMGCEPRLTSEMVDFVRCAERAGVDAAQIFSLEIGHGVHPTVAEMDRYYSTVIEATSLPVYLSSHRTVGYLLPVPLIESLVDRYPSIAGIAYGGRDMDQLAEIIARVGDRIEVHCTGATNALSTLDRGGNGFMGGEGNFCPELVAAVISAYVARDKDSLHESFGKLLAFVALEMRFGGNTSSVRLVKPLLNAFGLPGGTLRAPRLPISPAELELAVQEVIKLGIPGIPGTAQPRRT